MLNNTSPFEIRLWESHFQDVPPLSIMVGHYLGFFDEEEQEDDTDLDSAANEWVRQQALNRNQ